MSEDHKKQLEQQLWNIANTLRGKMNADEFRDYILGFIFYKYLAEKMEIYANTILQPDGIQFTDIDENTQEGQEYIEAIREEALEKLGYFLKPSELFSAIAKRGNHNADETSLEQAADTTETYNTKHNFILEDLQKILNNVQNSTMGTESEEDFDNLFEDMDLNSTKLGKTPEARNEVIAKVLAHLDKIDFQLDQTELDVLGDAYEYLIGKFASGAGKKAGEFYTPQEVSMVLAKLVTTGKHKLKSVYDPTCGSGSLLLRVAKEVEEVNNFYGQELNRTTYNLARMNMILHGVHYRKFDIKQEDTLEHPQHLEHRFEAIVANPPFSAEWSANPLFTSDDRFSQYGRLAPKKKADFAFVQHMIYQLADNGQMALVLPPGALYRGNAEKQIRKFLIGERNYLDAVIGLPENIFFGTGIPTCIMVFKKCRVDSENIIFINASKYFKKGKKQNTLRQSDIDFIVKSYRERKEVDKLCSLVSVEDIKKNDYNLNIARYVDTFIPSERIKLDVVSDSLSEKQSKIDIIDKEIIKLCNDLGVNYSLGSNVKLLTSFKEGLSQKLFEKEVRFTNNGANFPNWKPTSLSKIGKTYNGLSGKTKEDFGRGKPYIQYKQIFDHSKIDINGFDYVDLSSGENQNKVEYGDVFFTTSSETPHEVGFSSVFLDIPDEVYLNSFCFGFRINSFDELDPEYARFYFRCEVFRRNILKLAQGSTRYNISKSEMMKTKIELPDIVEQKLIAKILTLVSDKIDLINEL